MHLLGGSILSNASVVLATTGGSGLAVERTMLSLLMPLQIFLVRFMLGKATVSVGACRARLGSNFRMVQA
jgi:NADH:ubiquinone oxidoreductase subunit K